MHAVARCISALLTNRVSISGPPDLVPAHPGDTGCRLNRLVSYQRLIIFEVAIGEAPGRPLPVRKDIQVLSGVRDARLREAVAAGWRTWEDRIERGDR